MAPLADAFSTLEASFHYSKPPLSFKPPNRRRHRISELRFFAYTFSRWTFVSSSLGGWYTECCAVATESFGVQHIPFETGAKS